MDKKAIPGSLLWTCIAVAVMTVSIGLGIGKFSNPGAGFLGFWAGALLCVLSIFLALLNRRDKEEVLLSAGAWKTGGWHTPLLVVVSLVIYCLALPVMGYLGATFGFVAALFAITGIRIWLNITGSLLTSIITFILFDFLLKMPLPRGFLGF